MSESYAGITVPEGEPDGLRAAAGRFHGLSGSLEGTEAELNGKDQLEAAEQRLFDLSKDDGSGGGVITFERALADALGVPLVYWFLGGFEGEAFEDNPANHTPQFAPVMEPTLTTGVHAALAGLLHFVGR